MLALASSPLLPPKIIQEKVSHGAKEIFLAKLLRKEAKLPADYRPTDGSYFLAIPEGHDAKKPSPLVVAVCPFPKGDWMNLTWRDAAAKHKFLFLPPNGAGNDIELGVRGQRVLDAMHDVRQKYKIDAERIFVTGFSGGGRMSTALVMAFPDFFAGHAPMGGTLFGPDGEALKSLKTRLGHYLFSGETDANRKETEFAKTALDQAKIPAQLMIGSGKGHSPASPAQGLVIYEWFLARE